MGNVSELPAPRVSADSIALEIAFVRVPMADSDYSDLWRELDEQQLPTEIRRILFSNGFRCGLTGIELPATIRQWFASGSDDGQPNGTNGFSTENLTQWKVHQRVGHPKEIRMTSATRDRTDVLIATDGQLNGKTYFDADCILTLSSKPLADGSVQLTLLPEVVHGQPKSRAIVDQGTIRLEPGRKRVAHHLLQFDCTMSAGQTLVMSTTNAPKGLGRSFFTEVSRNLQIRKYLLIRVAERPANQVFGNQE